MTHDVLAEQRRYYRARAPEYDDWWYRRGRYALEPKLQKQWDDDVAEVEDALDEFAARGEVLELAAGTGIWTQRLARTATRVLAVDASPEALELNRARVEPDRVEYVVADLFAWEPPRPFDVCFFSFWHSHVPAELFDAFWQLVDASLRPDGRFFLIDSGFGDETHVQLRKPGTAAGSAAREIRRLSDGREFEIVKRYWQPEELAEALATRGWRTELRLTRNRSFLYGSGAR